MLHSPIDHTGVRAVTPPADSAIAPWYDGATLLDSYAVAFVRDEGTSMRAIAGRALEAPPAWARALMRVRDGVMAPLGIKTSDMLRRSAHGADRVDFFRVLAEGPDEVVLGEDDRHLDFRLSLLFRTVPTGTEIVATTAVRAHNALGRSYIRVIRPFHVAIVGSTLRRLAKPSLC
ncbi:MAG: DUF2867 domain-containing protein [Pseudomonadota bacterium]